LDFTKYRTGRGQVGVLVLLFLLTFV